MDGAVKKRENEQGRADMTSKNNTRSHESLSISVGNQGAAANMEEKQGTVFILLKRRGHTKLLWCPCPLSSKLVIYKSDFVFSN